MEHQNLGNWHVGVTFGSAGTGAYLYITGKLMVSKNHVHDVYI